MLLCGIPTEPPLQRVAEELAKRGEPLLVFNQRSFDRCEMEVRLDGKRADGFLAIEEERVALRDIRGVYLRLMDDRHLPELEGAAPYDPRRLYCRRLHDLLMRWSEIADARVINRPNDMASNMSKPYQAQLIRSCGVDVPPTLITDDPAAVARFRERCGRVIYKSMSGVRSIVRELTDRDGDRLVRIRACPAQFQQLIEGIDVRVHTVGARVFATRIDSEATDYRYPLAEQGGAKLMEVELPREWQERCVLVAARLGLEFAGIDLRITPEGRVYCFEVNPCPVYSYYENATGQPIAAAVADLLSGREAGSAPSLG